MLIGKFSFSGKLPRSKGFNYAPIFYDPDKESFTKRIKDLEEKNLPSEERIRPIIKFERQLQSKRGNRKVNVIRLGIFLFIIAAILYFVFN